MSLTEIIAGIDSHNEEAMIFAKKTDGKFLPSSEAMLIEVDDEETGLSTHALSEKYCPGFHYFLEVYLVKEVIDNLKTTVGFISLEQQVQRIINYAEFDA